jgi:hypothetical protein
MFGACGTVSEKGSELPEPEATARNQSRFAPFRFSVARKMPLLFATT